MGLAQTFQSAAKQILSLGGSTGTLIKTTIGAYDPDTGQAAETTANHAVQMSNLSPVEKWVNGQLVRMEEDEIIIGTHELTVVPLAGDRLTINSVDRVIASVQPVEAKNTTIFYKCRIER